MSLLLLCACAHLCEALQAFDDCTTIASIFKLLDSFEGLLDRGVIAADLERKHLDLVRNYGQDLKEVADTFRETKDSPPLNKNAAPHSGRVTWVRGLKERVGGTLQQVDVDNFVGAAGHSSCEQRVSTVQTGVYVLLFMYT